MKRLFMMGKAALAVTVVLSLLVSCGGSGSGSSAGGNAPLGKVPGYFVEMAQKREELDKKLREERDADRYQKKLKEYEEYVAETCGEAAEEGEKLVGNKIPCTGDVYPDLQVTGAKIAGYKGGSGTGTFLVRVSVVPKRDIMVRASQADCAEGEYSLQQTRLYYVLLRSDDHLITLGEINPFSANYSNASLKAEYMPGQLIMAGAPCHSEGSLLTINCHSYDFTDFAKIAFVSEADYKGIRKQAFGF